MITTENSWESDTSLPNTHLSEVGDVDFDISSKFSSPPYPSVVQPNT